MVNADLAMFQAYHEYSSIISGIDQLKETGKLVWAFFEYMEAQDVFFKRVTCDSRFDYIRERMRTVLQSRLRNLILSKVWTRACATFF